MTNPSSRILRIHHITQQCKGLVQYPKQVRQPNEFTCGHACLAMATGLPVDDIAWALSDQRGLSDDDIIAFLGLCGITANYTDNGNSPTGHNVHFGVIPSLNNPNKCHQILLFIKDGKWVLRDPNTGRKGKHTMTVKKWMKNAPTAYGWIGLKQHSFWIPNDPLKKVSKT